MSVAGLSIENGNGVGSPDSLWGGAILNFGSLTIADCTLSGNSTQGDGGGAINNENTLTISDSLLIDNSDAATDGAGGGAVNNAGGFLSVLNSALTGNSDESPAGMGGGAILILGGLATITNSTISGNTTESNGGGIDNDGGDLWLYNSTLADNTAPDGGGGAIQNNGDINAYNSTVADNTAVSGGGMWLATDTYLYNSTVVGNAAIPNGVANPYSGLGGDLLVPSDAFVDLKASIIASDGASGASCSGPTHDLGYNAGDDGTCGLGSTSMGHSSSLDSTIGPLAYNGGPTPTIALLPGSPAIDFVPAADCPATDQRGDYRSPPCDVGAFDTDDQTQIPQSISITSTAPSHAAVGGPVYGVVATGGGSGNPVVISSATPSVCAPSESAVSFVGVGICTVDANQPGNAGYAPAAQVSQTFSVGPGSQTITLTSDSPTNATVGGPPYHVTATGGASGNPVTFASSSPSTCTISGSSVSFVGAGTCVVEAAQAGSANYLAAPTAYQSFPVAKAPGPCSGSATRCFTSATGHSMTVGTFSSFSITTAGTPAPRITETGKLPKGVAFQRGTGIARLSGTPMSTRHKSAVGSYHLTITATFGREKTKQVVTQAVILTVVA